MAIAKTLNSTLDIIEAAAKIVADHPTTAKVVHAGKVVDRFNKAGGSLSQFTGQTNILSRVFIDERILDEAVLPNVMRSLHSYYTAQVIAALHLSQMVDSQRSVQDVMSIVQTGQNARQTGVVRHTGSAVWNSIRSRRTGQESFLSNYTGMVTGTDAVGLEDLYGPLSHNQATRATKKKWDNEIEQRAADHSPEEASQNQGSVQIKSVEHDARIGPMGQLFEVKLKNPNGGSETTVPIFVQMQPAIIPDEVSARFIDMNVSPSVWQRWTQMRAGELTFWRDFLLNRDLIRRQKSIIKDKRIADAFTDFLRTVAKKDKYAIDDATDRLGARQSANLANSVMIFSEDAVAQAKADSGIDLHSTSDRLRYFRDTYTMIIVIIDPLHQRVTMYFNGMEGEINTPYNDFRPKDTKVVNTDFMAALQAFSTNNIGRLR